MPLEQRQAIMVIVAVSFAIPLQVPGSIHTLYILTLFLVPLNIFNMWYFLKDMIVTFPKRLLFYLSIFSLIGKMCRWQDQHGLQSTGLKPR